jgi:hypothetical protein
MGFGSFILASIGMVLVIEGLFYAFFPEAFKDFAYKLSQLDPKTLRFIGLIMVLIGLGIITIFKSWLLDF